MTPIERRRFLQTSAVSLGTLLAGCVDGPDPAGDTEPTDTDEPAPRSTDTSTGTRSDGPSATPPSATELTDVATAQIGPRAASPRWYRSDESVGHVTLATTAERAHAMVDTESLPVERRDTVTELVRETDFDSALLALVETVGPNTCYETVELSNLTLDGDRLVGDAAAVDTSGDDTACGQALTYPTVLVRATFDGAPPEATTLSITDGWGATADVSASVDDRIGPDPTDLPGHVRPDDDPVVRAPLSCDQADFDRHESWASEPPWGRVTDGGEATFALRIDTLEAAYGETITVRLTNVSDAQQYTGNRHKHGIETLTEDGWQSVWGTTDRDHPLAYTDEAIAHRPGDGFEWTLELTEEGVLAGHTHADSLVVCPDLEPGRYRFVFWEPDVAVAFDLVA